MLRPEHLALVQDLIASPYCVYVHFAPPCGTSSRARLIQRKGGWNPPILRTERHPNGIPGLLARVEAANKLYQIICDLVEFCIQCERYFSVENPGRSFMWLTTSFQKLCEQFCPCVELRRISELCRQSMLQTVVSSGDPELDSQLYAATMKEVSIGFLIGPIELPDLPEVSTLIRRLGVKQKSKIQTHR